MVTHNSYNVGYVRYESQLSVFLKYNCAIICTRKKWFLIGIFRRIKLSENRAKVDFPYFYFFPHIFCGNSLRAISASLFSRLNFSQTTSQEARRKQEQIRMAIRKLILIRKLIRKKLIKFLLKNIQQIIFTYSKTLTQFHVCKIFLQQLT